LNINLPTSRVGELPVKSQIVFWFLVVTLLGIWPALTNGQPFFYADTTAYVRGADLAISKVLGSRFATDWATDQRRIIKPQSSLPAPERPAPSAAERKSARRVVLVGRSIVYGTLLYFGEVLGGMWFSIIIQSLIAAYLLFLFIVRTLGLDFRPFLISCFVLYIVSPLPFFMSFLMPDVFAGFLILGFAILATSWDRLSHVERAITGAVMLFAVLSHTTHFILLLGLTFMTLGYVTLVDRSKWINIRWFTATVAACIAIAVLWEFAFYFGVTQAFGSPPVRPPFVTAKLVSMLGESAVSKVCGSYAFVVCRFQDRFPVSTDAFLWSPDERTGIFSVVDVQTKRLLDDEQLRFALAIIPPNLGHFVAEVFLDALRQLVSIGLSDFFCGSSGLDFYRDRLPPDHFERMTSTFAARSDGYVVFGRRVQYVSAAIGAIITALLLGLLSRPRKVHGANEKEQERMWCEATYIQLAGITLNAIICGGFSTVEPRYQARVIWLIQLSLITGIALFWKRKTLDYAGVRCQADSGVGIGA
jgi:hypothetical protein